MANFKAGLVHTPVTPFLRDHKVDYELYAKVIEFHLRNGADSLALPMHAGESVSLTDDERKALLEFALKQVKGRVPVIAHVSQSGTTMAVALARHAEQAGAAAILCALLRSRSPLRTFVPRDRSPRSRPRSDALMPFSSIRCLSISSGVMPETSMS